MVAPLLSPEMVIALKPSSSKSSMGTIRLSPGFGSRRFSLVPTCGGGEWWRLLIPRMPPEWDGGAFVFGTTILTSLVSVSPTWGFGSFTSTPVSCFTFSSVSGLIFITVVTTEGV